MLAVILLCGLAYGSQASPGAADSLVSAAPYPVGNLEIYKEVLTTSTFKLKIRNLNLAPEAGNRNRIQTFLIAGARGKLPVVTIDSADFLLYRGDDLTSQTSFPPDNVKQNLARVAELGQFRQWWVYALTITSAAPGNGSNYWLLNAAQLHVDLGVPDNPETMNVSRYQSFGEPELIPSFMINPEISSSYYVSDFTDPVSAWESWNAKACDAAKSGELFSFSVYRGGVFEISRKDLEASAGKPVETSCSQWRVYSNGTQVPVIEAGTDTLLVPVPRKVSDGMAEQVYWVSTTAAAPGEQDAPARIQSVRREADVNSDSGIASVTLSQKFRELADYSPRFRSSDRMDRWVWKDLKPNSPERISIDLPSNFEPVAGSSVKLGLQYGFANFPSVNPVVKIFINGKESGGTTLTVQQGFAELFTPAAMWKPGSTTVTLILSYPENSEGIRPASFQSLEVTWTQSKIRLEDRPQFIAMGESGSTQTKRIDVVGKAGGANLKMVGFSNNQLTMLPYRNGGFEADSSYSSLVIFDETMGEKPAKLRQVLNVPDIKGLKSERSIIVTHPLFSGEAEELAAFHREKGLSASLITTHELYDLFNYGNPGSAGIRNGLRYLFYKGTGPAPEYVTLIGEASDFHGDPDIVPEETQLDFLPSASDASPEAPQGDQLYAAAIGSDLMSDFIVGRIPASKVGQVSDYLAKVKAYLAVDENAMANSAIFAMDDNDEFPEVVQRITNAVESPVIDFRNFRQWDYPYVPYLRVNGKKRSWEATQSLIDIYNHGTAVLNFFGHGGPNLWSHERLLHLSDLSHIHNSPLLPFISCASCDSAWISYPLPPVKASMGEQLVLKANGGGVGLLGPVSGASPYEHLLLIQNLMNGMGRIQLRNTGDLVLYAKNQYFAESRSSSIPDQYLLLGDPTVGLRIPRVQPGIEINQNQLTSGQEFTVFRKEGIGFPKGQLQIFSSFDDAPTSISIPIVPGTLSLQVKLPEKFPNGSANLKFVSDDLQTKLGVTVPVVAKMISDSNDQAVKVEGDQIELKLIESTSPAAGGVGNSNYRFSIRQKEEITSAVQVRAFINDQLYAEASRVELNSTAETNFELNSSIPISADASALSIKVISLNSSTNDVLCTASLYLSAAALPNLEIVPGTVSVSEGIHRAGHTVFVSALVRNTTKMPLRNVTFTVTRDDPTTGPEMQSINEGTSQRILYIAPESTQTITFRLEGTNRGEYNNLFFVANKTRTVRESNYEDNFAVVPPFSVEMEGNFRLESLVVHPTLAREGTTVTMTAVAQYENPANAHPVSMELGWIRSNDHHTSAITQPVSFQDGYATITRELVADGQFLSAFAKINFDLDVEENDSGDNQVQIDGVVAVPLAFDGNQVASLSSTIDRGNGYNISRILDDELRLADKQTSSFDFLLPDTSSVTSGAVTVVDSDTDNLWRMVPWSTKISAAESPGSVFISYKINGLDHDVPGEFGGSAWPEVSESQTIKYRRSSSDNWTSHTGVKSNAQPFKFDFGETWTKDGSLVFEFEPVGTDFHMNYFVFKPRAMEWLSPSYSFPEEYYNRPMEFSIAVNQADVEKVYLDCRTGHMLPDGNVEWSGWKTQTDNLQLQFTADQFLQLRVVAVPLPDAKPILSDFTLKAL